MEPGSSFTPVPYFFSDTIQEICEVTGDGSPLLIRAGTYELDAPNGETTVAVKLIDMLGEEVLVRESKRWAIARVACRGEARWRP